MGTGRKLVVKVKLTKRTVESLKSPPRVNGKPSQSWTYDSTTPRLAVCVWSSGSKIWYWVGKFGRSMVRLKLGIFPEITPEQAKRLAAKTSAITADGVDPRQARRQERNEPTFGKLFENWESDAKVRKKSWAEDVRMYEKFLKGWTGRKLSTITHSDVQKMHKKAGKQNGEYQANRILALVKAMFASAWQIEWKGDNPAAHVTMFPEQERDRFLQPDELKPFFQAVRDEPNETIRDFVLMLLWTGARRGNVQAMRYEEIDLTLGLWRIPETKSGKVIVVPLVEPAQDIIKYRQHNKNGSPWVFAGHGKSGHLMEPKATWQRIVKRAGLRDFRMHDLRRSLGSWQAITGSSLPVIGKSLGHSQARTTEIYARLFVGPVRESVDKAVAKMLATANGGETND